ncbi:MAG TPA: hypothetical protein VJM15_07280 [Sphingomicrobium sp.]|nr:hypothetical protein [Sphingomicrobium sp.]
MRLIKYLIGGAGLAALATAAPAAAQYYPYGYSNPYGYNNYAYGYNAVNTNTLAQRCTAAVQSRLYYRNTSGVGGIIGSIFGLSSGTNARVLNVTRVTPNNSYVRVRGLATSGRVAYNSYGPYGVGAYGALGYGYSPDLSYKCDIDYRGYIRDIDINRR